VLAPKMGYWLPSLPMSCSDPAFAAGTRRSRGR